MARRASASATIDATTPRNSIPRPFFAAVLTAWNWAVAIVLLLAIVWGAWQIEHLLITDKRFILEGPPEPGIPSQSFLVEGVRYASESQREPDRAEPHRRKNC
jgi:hypothetical protein